MRTTLLQRDICWADPLTNRRRLEQRLNELPPADLYVFPEMFSTGFCTNPEGIAEEVTQEGTLAWMRRVAVERGCALAGSVAVREAGKFYNRFYFVYPTGIMSRTTRNICLLTEASTGRLQPVAIVSS